jgi:hypothetical protein
MHSLCSADCWLGLQLAPSRPHRESLSAVQSKGSSFPTDSLEIDVGNTRWLGMKVGGGPPVFPNLQAKSAVAAPESRASDSTSAPLVCPNYPPQAYSSSNLFEKPPCRLHVCILDVNQVVHWRIRVRSRLPACSETPPRAAWMLRWNGERMKKRFWYPILATPFEIFQPPIAFIPLLASAWTLGVEILIATTVYFDFHNIWRFHFSCSFMHFASCKTLRILPCWSNLRFWCLLLGQILLHLQIKNLVII